MRSNLYIRIEFSQAGGRAVDFQLAYTRCGVQDLPMEVRDFNYITIDKAKRAYTGPAEIGGGRAAEATETDEED